MLRDGYDQELSTPRADARDAYVQGADALLGAMAEVDDHLQRAVDADPAFALGWIAFARSRFLAGDFMGAREMAAKARVLAQQATPREQGHVNAIALALEGKPVESLAATRAHLTEYPRDALVLAPATGVFGLLGFSGRPGREAELLDWLESLAPFYRGDWWFASVHAFAECECGKLSEARERIEGSMASNARNAHGAHVLAHVLHESGEVEACLAYLQNWLAGYEQRGLLHCHLSWHLALSALLLGRTELAWHVYWHSVHPGGSWGPSLNTVTDSVSFLWRARLASERVGPELWQQVKSFALESFPKSGLPFVDVHVAIACFAADDQAGLQRLRREVGERLAAGRVPAGDALPLLLDAFGAFGAGDWENAIERFEQALPSTVRIGGSRAQRDIVEHSLLAAYLEAGLPQQASRLLRARLERRPVVEVPALRSRQAGGDQTSSTRIQAS